MKVSREGPHICGILLGGICEPNTNTATADVDPERRSEFQSEFGILLFYF